MFGRRAKVEEQAKLYELPEAVQQPVSEPPSGTSPSAKWWRQMVRKERLIESAAIADAVGLTRSEVVDLLLLRGLIEFRALPVEDQAAELGRIKQRRRLEAPS